MQNKAMRECKVFSLYEFRTVFKVDLLYFVKFTTTLHVYCRHFVYPYFKFVCVTHASISNKPRFALDSVYTTKLTVSSVNASGFDPCYF